MAQTELIDIGMLMAQSLKTFVSNKRIEQGFRNPDTLQRIKYFNGILLQLGLIAHQTALTKNNDTSKKLRQLGNKMFQRGTEGFYRALELYNEAICWAEPYNCEDLAIAYANRSAVYFEWKEYQFCRDSIKLAKQSGYPDRLMKKLDDRDAESVTKLAEMKNKPQTKSKLKVTLGVDGPLPADQWKSLNPTPMYTYDKYHGEAHLSVTPNPKAPFAANCLDIKSDSKQGYNVVTNEDLKPGQVIAVEKPIVHAMTMRDRLYRYRKCANCYAENCLCLIPCTTCAITMYCSEECMKDSEQYHQYECPINEFLYIYCFGDTLSIRLLLKAYATFDSVSDLDDFCKTFDEKESKNLSILIDAGNDDKTDYRYVHGLATNESVKDNSKLLECYCKVASLYYVLINKTKFVEKLKTESDHDNLMKLLFRYVQISNQNSITCTQYKDFDMTDAGDNKSITIYSQGIYRFTSLLKHSCAPNIATVSDGSKLITYVTRVIKKGSQLKRCFCIGNNHYFQHTKSNRQKMLYNAFSLRCDCEACMKDYQPHDGGLAEGKLPSKYDMLLNMSYVFLDMEVQNLDAFLDILFKFDHMLPCLSLNDLQLRVHKIMKLKYGDISTSLKMLFKLHPMAAVSL